MPLALASFEAEPASDKKTIRALKPHTFRHRRAQTGTFGGVLESRRRRAQLLGQFARLIHIVVRVSIRATNDWFISGYAGTNLSIEVRSSLLFGGEFLLQIGEIRQRL